LINASEFGLQTDQQQEKQKNEEITKIKQAFYEVLEELRNNQAPKE
jgi:hypothetical protein